MLSSGMITPPLFIFPGNFTHSAYCTIYLLHRLDMELDLQRFIWAPCHVMCTAVLIVWDPATPSIPSNLVSYIRGRYLSAKIDDISFALLNPKLRTCRRTQSRWGWCWCRWGPPPGCRSVRCASCLYELLSRLYSRPRDYKLIWSNGDFLQSQTVFLSHFFRLARTS